MYDFIAWIYTISVYNSQALKFMLNCLNYYLVRFDCFKNFAQYTGKD